MSIQVSIICPTYNEEKYIAKCIESIIAQDFPIMQLEVLFVDGRSTDATRSIIANYQQQHSCIKLLDNPEKIVPFAMNKGIANAQGEIIIRIDAHSFYPTNYVSVLVSQLVSLEVDNVGVVCKTDVLNKNKKTLAIREVLSNPFGVGNSLFRTGVDEITEVDTVPFGCYRKDVFQKHGLYDTRLIRNQDIELNKRIKRGGGRIFLIPETFCTYYARETFRGIMKNNFQNGKWNILTVYHTKMFDSLSLRHFIPMFFVLSLFFPLGASLFYFPFILLGAFSFSMYVMLVGILSLKLSLSKEINFFYLFSSFISLHVSYGIGSLAGIFNVLFKK
ncbi:glycosyltransferase family 2 protein [Flavobacterium acetivorans]|uniref:glycosyltransferase family 2 protein n=1 Tax=Flavobacterium acetivorans TaxID=2893883 RepID=UPI001E2B6D69|nr:glycosyltransferase family 2 protein [Flavobacterium sp. F-29]UFH35762.1 glycosyltransferase family 2 protein [Flavobacterium sp. F-29]